MFQLGTLCNKSTKLRSTALLTLFAMATLVTVVDAAPVIADLKKGDKIRFFDRPGTIGGGEYGVAKLPAKDVELFRTFCIERNESLDFTSAGFVVKDISSKTSSGKKLAAGAAYLYWEFRHGTLAGYDTSTSTRHTKSANALQAALWLLQKESGYNLDNWWSDDTFQSLDSSIKSKALAFKTLAQNAVANGLAKTAVKYVKVANIVWTKRKDHKGKTIYKDGDPAQDVLILVPEPASIVFWGTSIGIGGVGAVIRRRRRPFAL
jgi:hypothetical protein